MVHPATIMCEHLYTFNPSDEEEKTCLFSMKIQPFVKHFFLKKTGYKPVEYKSAHAFRKQGH